MAGERQELSNKRQRRLAEFVAPFRVKPGSKVTLEKDFDPSYKAGLKKKDGVELLEEGVRLSDEVGVKAYLARWTTLLGEGFLTMGDVRRAGEIGERALDLARAHGERGHEAAALRLLADVAGAQDPPVLATATEYYTAAIALAEELALRPLLARSHLGLGQVHRRAGRAPEAEAHLASAIVLFADLGMLAWLDDRSASFSPEYESCRRIADEQKLPLKTVYDAARKAWS